MYHLYHFFLNIAYLSKANLPSGWKLKVLFKYLQIGALFLLSLLIGKRVGTIRAHGYRIRYPSAEVLFSIYGEIFVKQEYSLGLFDEEPYCRDGCVIVDAGANIGLATLYFALFCPAAKIVAIEPDPSTYGFLRANVEGNELESRVTTYQYALTDADDVPLSFFVSETAGDPTMSTIQGRGGKKEVQVKGMRLSTILDKHGLIGGNNVLKMDVEGAEGKVLNDLTATQSLEKFSNIIIEFHHHVSPDLDFSRFLSTFSDRFDYHLSAEAIPRSAKYKFQDIVLYFYAKRPT